MSSLAAKTLDLAFRALMVRDLSTHDKLVKQTRRLIKFVRPPAMLPSGVTVRKTTIANTPGVPPGSPAYCVSTKNPTSTVLYVHGGAFICGVFSTYANICGQLAKRLNARVFWVDYRLAPEMPYPAPLDDVFNAYSALATDYPKQPLAIIGDSAGGNLALGTLLRVRDTVASGECDSSLRLPACVVAMSPITDFASELPSRKANAKSDCVLTPQIIQFAGEMYLNGHDPRDPYVSPVYGVLQGLPPIMMAVSDIEAMRDDVYRFAHCARKEGVRVEILSRDDVPHAWPVLYSILPEARKDIAEISRFMRTHLQTDSFIKGVASGRNAA
ncbi:alpha/beta hydrolase [Zhongshania arctica]|uniref:Alpha/beta hydrolase n=1 Tax=Zhongshania arctica TaxID=3238302 RepID=A0ABV3TRK8_9GAMM